MLVHFCLAAIPLIVGFVAPDIIQTDPNYAINGGFEEGLTGWTASGDVHIDKTSPVEGAASARLGAGKASVSQRYKISGLRIMGFGAKAVFSNPSTQVKVHARCFDAKNKLVMDLSAPFDTKNAATKKGAEAGLYFKTQGHTAYMIVSIEKEAGQSAIVDSAWIHDYDKNREEHAPECDLDAYMHPVWEGTSIVDESVLLLSNDGLAPKGKLLYDPTRIVSVRDSTLRRNYKEGLDFTVKGNVIAALPGSSMPSLKDTDFPTTAFPWLSVASKHLFVTYEHSAYWAGPVPTNQGSQLPRLTEKLRDKRPVTIVALGDSITLGIDTSGYRMKPPYMPTWPELAVRQLKKNTRNDRITLYNAALGGMTSEWGRDNAKDAVASLKPDLVLIAFGMNDFWSVSPDQFRNNVAETIKNVLKKTPKAEFVLVSSIRFDPAYTTDPMYIGHMTSYRQELEKLAGNGICLLDFTSLSDFLYKAKNAKDLLADPMHPDDFFARILAQFLVKTLTSSDIGKRVN